MSGILGRLFLALSLLGVLGAGIGYWASADIRWRVDVVASKLAGRIDGVTLAELLKMMVPRSGYYLEPLAETKNPYSSIFNPFDGPEVAAEGETLFSQRCASCHGHAGVGVSGPALTRPVYDHGDSDWAIYKVVRDGVPGTAMTGHDLGERGLWSLVAYLRALQRGSAADEAGTDLAVPLVTSEMLVGSAESPNDWLMYSGAFDGKRFSRLSQFTPANAHRAAVRWIYQFEGSERLQETSPIVNDGVMYITEAPNVVHALDAASGRRLWSYTHPVPDDVIVSNGLINRGVAVGGDKVYLGTLDSHLVALDAASGRLEWSVSHHDYRLGSSVTSAPLVVDDKVIVGYGGGDMGLRGILDAFDAKTGELAWRFHTVPGKGEPGNETWGDGDAWKYGGAATWLTGSYDPESRLLFWPTGNPAPDYQGDLRPGDNLYSCSMLALDVDTGELAWHFQFVPHDEHDWDANQIPVLVDRTWRGEPRNLLLQANRNGFFYVLDRNTGEFLMASEFAKQNWALEIDDTGRPVLNPDTILTTQGRVTWPSPIGAHNWQSPSYSPKTGLMYVPTLEFGQIVFKNAEPEELDLGETYLGGFHTPIPGDEAFYFAVRAIDPETGEIVWEYRNPSRRSWWKTAGLVGTDGDVIFGGDDTDVFILDAETGRELFRQNVGGRINAAPITYAVDGTQYFSISAGRALITFALDDASRPD